VLLSIKMPGVKNIPDAVEIFGYCDPRFSAVKEAFRQNFESGLEIGASFAE
jgi:hypothetical protein